MPVDKKKCVEYKDKLYCYNPATGKIDEYKITSFDIEKCPIEPLRMLMSYLSKKEEN
jgi:hypothetical protein